MPPRLNKRQQRELEELEALSQAKDANEPPAESDSEVESTNRSKAAGGGFATLFTPGDDEAESDEGETSQRAKKSKKKKKKTVASVIAAGENAPPKVPRPTPLPQAPLPRNEKKAKAREKKAGKDELEKALAELSVKYPDLKNVTTESPATAASRTEIQKFAELLSVSLPHLDSEAEMKKFFGAKVVSANRASGSSPGGARKRTSGVQRSHLTHPQSTWWASKQREGLSIALLSPEQLEEKVERHSWDELSGEKWWSVEYSKRYKSMTMAFLRVVMSGDPEGFWNLLGKLPWHADTLLQLSEVYRHREEYGQAVDYVERALFTYERAFVGSFNFTSGINRLDFDQVENRPFFLAIHRQITDLQRKGCVRTSFEFSRLLYSMDPWNDPHGMLMHLDYLALKCGMSQWLLDVYDHFEKSTQSYYARMKPNLLPGWAYARALALRITEGSKKSADHTASTEALKEAIVSFPSIVPLLADKIEVNLSSDIRGHRSFRIETGAGNLDPSLACLHLLSHLYAQRSAPLWKDPLYTTWFETTVSSHFSKLPTSELPSTTRRKSFIDLYAHPGPQYAAYRHLIVLESTLKSLFTFIPPHIAAVKSLSCDPLPPTTATTAYNDTFFKGTEDLFALRPRTRRDIANDARMLERLVPDGFFRQQLQGLFDAQPQLQERFPGGVVQFAQAAAQLPMDVLEGMMLAEMAGGEDGEPRVLEDRGMPGQMPGEMMLHFGGEEQEEEEDVGAGGLRRRRGADPEPEAQGGQDLDDSDEEYDAEEEEEVVPLPLRVVRGLVSRFWGQTPVEEDSSDEEGDLIDPEGVD